jgi:predicted adenine nucleotide alpha hydrolase (AANH) superfamily ATPase
MNPNNDHNQQIDKDKALTRQRLCGCIFKIVN